MVRSSVNPNSIKVTKIIQAMIELIEKLDKDVEDERIIRESTNGNVDLFTPVEDEETNNQEDNKYGTRFKVDEIKEETRNFIVKKEYWKRKVYRFLAFCLNGGLTDFTFTFETFIDMIYRLQNINIASELDDIVFYSMNLCDLDSQITEESHKIYIPSINEKTNLSFNEDILCICIKTGWLSKNLSESVKHAPAFMKILIKKYCTNKILNAIYCYLRLINEQTGEDTTNTDERNSLNVLIPDMVEIYSDIRRCPTTLVLAAKCMCALVCKDTDKKNRKILIQEDIVPKLAVYFDYYDFDDKLLIISLELLSFVLPELKLKVNEYLSDIKGVNLLTNFKNILTKTKAPGTFFSQRVSILLLKLI